MRRIIYWLVASLTFVSVSHGWAQDANYLRPIPELEARLRDGSFRIINYVGARAQGDRTQYVTLEFPDSVVLGAQLAKAPAGGAVFNNQPRYELAAYELQKLFLEPDEFVVPPTVIRAFPLAELREFDPGAAATFDEASSVVAVLQYWLQQVTSGGFYDRDRARGDTVYARYLGNFNILTYLIRHSDANVGNYLISQSSAKPRVFSVDNGVAFDSQVSDRGFEWRNIRVERLPHATIERLRAITLERLRESLGVLVQFEVQAGVLVAVARGDNLDDGRGVRRSGGVVQFGLTEAEIRRVAQRLRELLRQVDEGKRKVF